MVKMEKLIFKTVSVIMILSITIGLVLQIFSEERNPIYAAMVMTPLIITFVAMVLWIIYELIFD